MNRDTYEMLNRLQNAGISYDDAIRLRRISMTLRRWFELECGNSDHYQSWAIERDPETDKPYMVMHPHTDAKSYRYATPDRETGARRRLADIMRRYPDLRAYVQTDPRGCALRILRPDDAPIGQESMYSDRGIAVYQ